MRSSQKEELELTLKRDQWEHIAMTSNVFGEFPPSVLKKRQIHLPGITEKLAECIITPSPNRIYNIKIACVYNKCFHNTPNTDPVTLLEEQLNIQTNSFTLHALNTFKVCLKLFDDLPHKESCHRNNRSAWRPLLNVVRSIKWFTNLYNECRHTWHYISKFRYKI